MSRPLPELFTSEKNIFINKPPQGWLHSDNLISKKGVTYAVRYIGCLEVNISMKSLDFSTRSQVAKECINRVCEVAGLKTPDKKRKVEKTVQRCIGNKPIMDHAGTNVNLTVCSTSLILTAHDSGNIIAEHEMPRISFASGGDTDTLDFVGYVAKDLEDWRACYVLECGGGLAQDVIATIAQAFELRLKQFLTNMGTQNDMVIRSDDGEYYNDLPGKIPPDVGPPPVPPLPAAHHHTVINIPASEGSNGATNLIDFHSEPSQTPTPGTVDSSLEYVNVIPVASDNGPPAPNNDVFDLKHLGVKLGKKQSSASQRNLLENEIWFHGFASRQEAEALLTHDGEFLVRESQGSPGQYVLTGMQGGVKKHLLLIDPEGVVRTKDKMFESVSHLINYHVENQLPIISAESALVLRHPISKACH
ncbi:hypothetical protein RUM44_005487 [Polyplax serrata]|uniref:SHC-transforming protein 1 n=1 Tax=Polyplax serrata TaxID=468196 RepID=A0ABR1ADZ0_POLSC